MKTKTENKKLSKQEALALLSRAYGIDLAKCAYSLRLKIEDHTLNPLAPEAYCYKFTFTLWGTKHKLAFWPHTVGFQGY